MKHSLLTTAAVTVAVVLAQQGYAAEPPRAIDLKTWDTSKLEQGWSADALLDQDVHGPDGNEIGEVEDILIGPDNKIQAVIVETDAFLDIGDVHAMVPWDKISAGPEPESISVPVTKETLENFRVDYDDRSVPRAWRVEEFIGDRVRLEDQPGYGLVDDVIFGEDGEIAGVIVDATYRRGYGVGPYAYPYYGSRYGWEPGSASYELPYTESEVAGYSVYEYEATGPFAE